MSIQFDTPAEAFAAVAAVVVAADKVGSLDERKFLFEQVRTLEVFQGQSLAEFERLLNGVVERIYDTLSNEDVTLTTEDIEALISAAKKVLSPGQQKAVVQMAAELCNADGLSQDENTLLKHLERGFNTT